MKKAEEQKPTHRRPALDRRIAWAYMALIGLLTFLLIWPKLKALIGW